MLQILLYTILGYIVLSLLFGIGFILKRNTTMNFHYRNRGIPDLTFILISPLIVGPSIVSIVLPITYQQKANSLFRQVEKYKHKLDDKIIEWIQQLKEDNNE